MKNASWFVDSIPDIQKMCIFFMSGCAVGCEYYSVFAGKHVSSPCPLNISPPVAAVRFGDPLWANCTALTEQIQGMGWESSQGGTPLRTGISSIPLNIKSVTDWGLSSHCFINSLDGEQCMTSLPVTVYSKF